MSDGDNPGLNSLTETLLVPRYDQDDDGNSNSNSNHVENMDIDINITTDENNVNVNVRRGTITSARFNILSTMVGGGALSVPLAFHQAGNVFLAPILLFVFAALVKTSIHLLIDSAIMSSSSSPVHVHVATNKGQDSRQQGGESTCSSDTKKGTTSYEATACAAFGPRARYLAMSLVATICYLTVVGYGVLLRDMLLPISDYIFGNDDENDASLSSSSSSSSSGPTFHHNITMLTVVLFVSPLCTMKDLTPLEKVGALSMMSITAVACCISYRSYQCNFSPTYDDIRLMPWYEYINFMPEESSSMNGSTNTNANASTTSTSAFHNLLNAIPILINIYMCHFNVLPVHNELQNPTPRRVNTLFTSSIWGACIFYLFVGFTGSMYGNCTPNGQVEGNVLLSFGEDDVLLLIGRFCLSLTITFAFPVLVVPCRDILLRAWDERGTSSSDRNDSNTDTDTNSHFHGEEGGGGGGGEDDALGNEQDASLNLGVNSDLGEPLLPTQADDANNDGSLGADNDNSMNACDHEFTKRRRKIVSIIIFWSGAAVACCVKSIDIVWDLLGGSLSLMMGFLIPSAAYSLLWKRQFNGGGGGNNQDDEGDEEERVENGSTELTMLPIEEKSDTSLLRWAYLLIAIFAPMVFVLTGNAIYNVRNE